MGKQGKTLIENADKFLKGEMPIERFRMLVRRALLFCNEQEVRRLAQAIVEIDMD